MDGDRFDALTKSLATAGTSRRRFLRGAAAGLAAAAGLRALGARAGQEKQALCHATGDPANPWAVISVAEPAWQPHFDHGDHAFVDCCADADCPLAGQTCGGGGVAGECGQACVVADPTACLGPGAVCLGDCSTCCSRGAFVCGDNHCCGDSTPGDTCAEDSWCGGNSSGYAVCDDCNRCCVASGRFAGGFGSTCAECCSGGCLPDGVTCA